MDDDEYQDSEVLEGAFFLFIKAREPQSCCESLFCASPLSIPWHSSLVTYPSPISQLAT
jgi:hypothetical protein